MEIEEQNSNPLMGLFVRALAVACLIALAVQTWFFISWLMGSSEEWMKYVTLCFFDIAGGVWILFRLYHFPPNRVCYQVVTAGIGFDFLLSATTTIAWTFIFITRTPLTSQVVASMVDTARWIVAVAVIANSFAFIFYGFEVIQARNARRQRWANDRGVSNKNWTRIPAVTSSLLELPPAIIEEEKKNLTRVAAKLDAKMTTQQS